MDIKLHIIIQNPLPGVAHALQKGDTHNCERIDVQQSAGSDMVFELAVKLRDNNKQPFPTFSGPFVHGPTSEQFIYILVGTSAGQFTSPWTRRLKIPLYGMAQQIVDEVAANSALVLQTTVPGVAKDGGPNCATVKPFDGWKVMP